jgi:hypothetical protein
MTERPVDMPEWPYPTSVDLLVLHALRCIGFAGVARVAEATGFSAAEVESELLDLAASGLVTRHRGEFGGWGLTDAGRGVDAERIAAELDAAGARDTVAKAYDGFLVLNPELLDLCTAWLTRPTGGVAPVDRTGPTYDSRVLDRLADLDRRAGAVCADLSAAVLRFRRYRVRLTYALTRVRSGAFDYVADGTGSYHSVWFQLHEDLLVTLGLPRH